MKLGINYGENYRPYGLCLDSANDNGTKGDEGGGANNPPAGYVPKAEIDKISSDLEKIRKENEDLRLEIFTPEYMEYLGEKKAGKKSEPVAKSKDETDFSKLTPDQLYLKAKEDAKKEMEEKIEGLRKDFTSKSQADVQKEIAAFARTHEDFEKYRPLMHGLSTDPKNKDLTLQELYALAKQHAKGFGPTEEEKTKSRKAGNEKPGGSSNSMQKDKKYTPDSAADEAWNEALEASGGNIPSIT